MVCRESEDFLDLDTETVWMIFSNDSLNIESDMAIFYQQFVALAILERTKKKSTFIDKVMGCVRFPLLTGEQPKYHYEGICPQGFPVK